MSQTNDGNPGPPTEFKILCPVHHLYVMLCYGMLCYVMLCYVMLCYVMLCYVKLCYVMLRYVMLCYVMLYCVLTYGVQCSAVLYVFIYSNHGSLLRSNITSLLGVSTIYTVTPFLHSIFSGVVWCGVVEMNS